MASHAVHATANVGTRGHARSRERCRSRLLALVDLPGPSHSHRHIATFREDGPGAVADTGRGASDPSSHHLRLRLHHAETRSRREVYRTRAHVVRGRSDWDGLLWIQL